MAGISEVTWIAGAIATFYDVFIRTAGLDIGAGGLR